MSNSKSTFVFSIISKRTANSFRQDDLNSNISGDASEDIAKKFQAISDLASSCSNDNDDIADESTREQCSPNKLLICDEAISAIKSASDNEEDDVGSSEQVERAPRSPDGITSEDPPIGRCETCDLSFNTKRERSEHLRDVHGVAKPFKCEYCSARFPYSSSLYNHVRIHSESKPFKCTICQATFRWKNSLHHHLVHIHKEEPSNIRIDAKCVLEGKKPPTTPNEDNPIPKRPSKNSKKKAAVSSTDLLDPNYILKSDPDSDAGPSRLVESADGTSTKNGTRKRKRKSATELESASVKAHTCGHCEKVFSIWSDLVDHIKNCAEAQKGDLDDQESREGISAGDGGFRRIEECGTPDSDSSEIVGGLVIDQDEEGMKREDSSDEYQSEQGQSDERASGISNNDSKRKKLVSRIDSKNDDEKLKQRVDELEKRLDEITRNYEDRIGNLELAINQLKSQINK